MIKDKPKTRTAHTSILCPIRVSPWKFFFCVYSPNKTSSIYPSNRWIITPASLAAPRAWMIRVNVKLNQINQKEDKLGLGGRFLKRSRAGRRLSNGRISGATGTGAQFHLKWRLNVKTKKTKCQVFFLKNRVCYKKSARERREKDEKKPNAKGAE